MQLLTFAQLRNHLATRGRTIQILCDLINAPNRKGACAVSHNSECISPEDNEIYIAHDRPEMAFEPFDKGLLATVNILQSYAGARHARTDLVHCYMPCRAMSTPVTFVHLNPANRRFEGLIDCSEAELAAMQQSFDKLGIIFQLIEKGLDENSVRAAWRELWLDELKATAEYLQSQSRDYERWAKDQRLNKTNEYPASHPVPPPAELGSNEETDRPIEIAFALDRNLLRPAATTLSHLLRSTQSPIRLHLCTRGISRDELTGILLTDTPHANSNSQA